MAEYLIASRGIQCVPEQVAIVSGVQEALDLVARLFLNPGDRVCMEFPDTAARLSFFRHSARRLDPGQRFGAHNFRHSLATFLINSEKDAKTVQGLLRHADVSTTLGLYAQSENSSMVEAHDAMLKAILRNDSNAVNWSTQMTFYR